MQTTPAPTPPKHTAPLVLAIALLLAPLAALAQTTPPAPQSVAPAYTAPAATYPAPPAYVYVPTKAGTWDFYLNVGYASYGDSTHNNTTIWNPLANGGLGGDVTGDMKFKFDDDWTFGFGFDYNITDRLALGAEFSYSQPGYDATFLQTSGALAGEVFSISGDADIYTGNAFVQYSFTNKSKLTPYIRGNIGFAWIDTGIPDGPPEEYWWWDWWWGGYDVITTQPTKSDTFLTLGVTGGLRYDFPNHVYLTAAYDASWTNAEHDWLLAQRVSLSIGWNY